MLTDIAVNDVIEGVVSDFGSEGEGVIKMGRYPIFVPFAIKGETVRVRVKHAGKDFAHAELLEVLAPSECRVKPRCPYFGRCGGCDLQHISLEGQLEIKRNAVASALKKFAGVDFDVPLPVSLNQFEYRNKISLPFAYNRTSGRVSLGFFEKRTHKVVPLKWCPLHGQWAADVIQAVSAWANECGISVYDEASGKGVLRHVVARMLDDLSLTVVVNADELPHLHRLSAALAEKFSDFCIYVSPNKKAGNAIFGDSVRLVFGEEREQRLGGFSARVSPKSFLQVNEAVRDAIYADVAAELAGGGDIVELYSGVGLLTAQLALLAPDVKIAAVEIEPEASATAAELARKLRIDDRVECVCEDALAYMKRADVKGGTLVLDPPRRGCDEEVLRIANERGFDKIIYISCNPITLARDIARLGWKLESVRPYDMFPCTANVETLAVLSRA